MGKVLSALKASRREKKLLEISIANRSLIGRAVYLDQKYCVAVVMDKQGKEDGYALFRIDAVRTIAAETTAIHRVRSYMAYWREGGLYQAFEAAPFEFDEGTPLLLAALYHGYDSKLPVTLRLRLGIRGVTCFIHGLKEDLLTLDVLDVEEARIEDRIRVFVDEIRLMRFDNLDNRLLGSIFAHGKQEAEGNVLRI